MSSYISSPALKTETLFRRTWLTVYGAGFIAESWVWRFQHHLDPAEIHPLRGPWAGFSIPFISQYRGPSSNAAAAPFSVAMACGSSADHNSAGQSLRPKLL